MQNTFNEKSKYIDILNRIHKKYSKYEGILIMKKKYFTDNIFYYFLCLLTRFFYLLSFCGNYSSSFSSRFTNFKSFQQYIKSLLCFNILNKIQIRFKIYVYIIIILCILYIIKLMNYYFILRSIWNYNYFKKYILPNKYLIIIEHIEFILFPYLIEFLSFPYYILFLHDKFILSLNTKNIILYGMIIINTILIILFNIENCINIICCNKIYTTTIFDAYLDIKNEKINDKKVKYRQSLFMTYLLILLQNFNIFLTIDNFLNFVYKIYFKIIISIILALIFIIIIFKKSNEFIFSNLINKTFYILLFFCFYSIIFDFIIYIIRYLIINFINEIVYVITKLIISYISYLLFILKNNYFLEKKLLKILNNTKKDKYFIDCFYYLHEIMKIIKKQKETNSAFLLIKFLSKSPNNQKLFDAILKYQDENKIKLDNKELDNYISELSIILNYLFEIAFVNYDFYNNYDMSILLAEHYCHCQNNPTLSFSIIFNFMIKNRSSIFQMADLYELSQKYIYYITCNNLNKFRKNYNNKKLLIKINEEEELKEYYKNIKILNDAKKSISNFVYNELKIFKFKHIFEDSLSFKFDDTNENIISVKIDFFNKKSKLENFEDNNNKSSNNFRNYDESNLTNLDNIIHLLRRDNIFYRKIISSIIFIDPVRGIPISMLYKFILFFDIFEGGKIPEEIKNKIFLFLKGTNINNAIITRDEYEILKKRYNKESNKLDSKFYLIIELKKELLIKYFSEDVALKLGFNQRDIINEKLDYLLPIEFFEPHQNLIKHLVIGQQKLLNFTKPTFVFDKNRSTLYSANLKSLFIYNISKNLIFFLETNFIFENQYKFMLNNNFKLLANSKNFEDEYFLNKSLLQIYNIEFLNILKIKQEKIFENFKKEFKKIQKQKHLRQARADEYIIHQIYNKNREKNFGLINRKYFNNILNSILLENGSNNKIEENMNINEEEKNLIANENIKKSMREIFRSSLELSFHKSFKIVINKKQFIRNIAKELNKIPKNDLKLENDQINYNLIISAKKLISNLLTKKDLANSDLNIIIKFTYFFDKTFFFITIDDEKKLYINISKKINFQKNEKLKSDFSIPKNSSKKNKIPYDKINKKSISRNIIKNDNNILKKNSNNINKINLEKIDFEVKENNKNKILNKIIEKQRNINKDNINLLIKIILSITTVSILIISLIIIFFQKYLLNISEKMLLTYFYNSHVRQILLYAHSRTIQILYDYYNLTDNRILTEQEYQNIITSEAYTIKENYHSFKQLFFEYNLLINHNIDILYKKRKYKKLRGNWEEIDYTSDYATEINYIIYTMHSIDVTNKREEKLNIDMDNFMFFRGRNGTTKVYTSFIKLVYYLCSNYAFIYKDLFLSIDEEIFNSYRNYIDKNNIYYSILEILQLLFYIINCLLVSYYLYFSNEIIVKNIIFLFIDFNEENYNIKQGKDNIIYLKLISFQNLINDFNLNNFENFERNINKLNMNISIFSQYNDNWKKNINNKKDIVPLNNNKNMKIEKNEKNHQKEKLKNLFFESNNLFSGKNMNNSSQSNLFDSNQLFLGNKLNNYSINSSNDAILNKSISSSQTKQNINNFNNQSQNENKEKNEKINDLIFNKSNKTMILLTKIYLIVMFLLFSGILIFSIYKFKFTLNSNNKIKNFFLDFSIITNRYAILYYYFNQIRTLLIYPQEEKKKKLEVIMEGLNGYYEIENKKFLNVFSKNMDSYKEIVKLFNILTESKNDVNEIKEVICGNQKGCNDYLDSDINIFTSGVDFGYKACLTKLTNIYMDYKKLSNNTDLVEVNSTIINGDNSPFVLIGVGLGSCIMYVINKIFEKFKIDVLNFNESFNNNTNLLNIISIAFSILTFLFIIIIVFISISNFIRPIKKAVYRITCSFFYIKKYSIIKFQKMDSIAQR